MNLLKPRNVKYDKMHKGRIKVKYKQKNSQVTFGSFGIKSIEAGKLTYNQIESFRRTITNNTKRKVKIWIKAFPNTSITSKAIGVRMGKGKGAVKYWVYKVYPGNVLFELSGQNLDLVERAIKKAGHKLPIKFTVVRTFKYIN